MYDDQAAGPLLSVASYLRGTMVTDQSSNQSITPDSRPFVEELARFANRPDVVVALREAQSRATERLKSDSTAAATVEAVSLAALNPPLPAIGSVRVAVIREGFDGGFERHANSTQYLLALEGVGETHVETPEGWRIDRYGIGDRLEDRWHLVPEGVWHKSAAPGPGHWTVVAFHTAIEVQDEFK